MWLDTEGFLLTWRTLPLRDSAIEFPLKFHHLDYYPVYQSEPCLKDQVCNSSIRRYTTKTQVTFGQLEQNLRVSVSPSAPTASKSLAK